MSSVPKSLPTKKPPRTADEAHLTAYARKEMHLGRVMGKLRVNRIANKRNAMVIHSFPKNSGGRYSDHTSLVRGGVMPPATQSLSLKTKTECS